MNIVAIIQARMGSTRLPGKVLKDLNGESMLWRVVSRLQRSRMLNDVLVATTNCQADDEIAAECSRHSVRISRGDQDDVLDRYFRAAQLIKADIIVRITSDCPLIDPGITDKTVGAFLAGRPDYASNTLERTYPRGLDAEVMSFETLERTWRLASARYEREHVTPYIYERPMEFKLLSVTGGEDQSCYRWTVDTQEDLAFVRAVYDRMGTIVFSWRDVLDLLEREPSLPDLNRSVRQKNLY
jgi:spore coat polysaccharide biosynthesis protein SpsF